MKSIALALSIASLPVFASSVAHAACGQLEVSKGDVKIESAGKASPAAVGAKICAGDTIIAGKDSRAKIKMEDGNELNVSPDSKIALETYQFVPAQNKKKVLLNILQGKVRAATKQENMYNDKSADGSDNTFQVKTKSAVAGVRGTDFLTGFDPKTNKSEVVTFKGKVEFGQPGPGGTISNSVQVGAGQKTDMAPGQPPAPPKPVPPKEMQQLNSDTKADSGGQSSNSNNSGGDKKSEKKDDKGGDKQASGDKQGDGKGDKQGDGKSGEKQGDAKGGDKQGDSKGGDKQASGDNKQGGDSKGDNKQASGDNKQAAGDSSKGGGEKQQPGGGDNKQATGNASPSGDGKQTSGGSESSSSGGGGKPGAPRPDAGGGTSASNGGSPSGGGTSGGGPVAGSGGPNGPAPAAGSPSGAGPGPSMAMPSGPSDGGAPRAPAMSMPPMGSMIGAGDLSGGTTFVGTAPTGPALPPIIVAPTLPPPVVVAPICQTCLDVPKGPTRLTINITVK